MNTLKNGVHHGTAGKNISTTFDQLTLIQVRSCQK